MELTRKKIVAQQIRAVGQGSQRQEGMGSAGLYDSRLGESVRDGNIHPLKGDGNSGAKDQYLREYTANRERIMARGLPASQNSSLSSERDQQRKQELHQTRSQSKALEKKTFANNAKDLKNMASMASPMGGLSLLKQIDFMGDMPYVLAIMAALGKDILDFTGWDFIGLGTLMGICCGIFIFMMMLLVDAGDKKKTTGKWVKKMLTLSGGVMLDAIPVIDFLPIETITVGVLYVMTLMDRKNAQQ